MSVEFHVSLVKGELSEHYHPKFESVAQEFERNYRETGDTHVIWLHDEPLGPWHYA